MIEELRRFLSTPAGKILSILVTIGIVIVAIYSASAFFKGDTPDSAFYTTYICTETGKSFRHKNELGEIPPILSPYSGKNTAYAAEACYWTADGKSKTDPDWVLLNETVHKTGPTFCPVCGRLVVGHNPQPEPGKKAPPTQAEYLTKHPVDGGN